MTQSMSSSRQELKVSNAVNLEDSNVLTEGQHDAGLSEHITSEEMASQDEKQLVLLKRIGARLVNDDSGELSTPTISILGHLIPGAESCVIFFSDPIRNQLYPEAVVNLSQEFVNLLHVKEQEEGLITAALEQAEPYLVIYLPGNKHFKPIQKIAHREGIRTLWLVTLRDRDKSLLGVILFASGQAFSPGKQALASAKLLTEWISTALNEAHGRKDNERLRAAFDSVSKSEMSINRANKITVINQTLKQLTRPGEEQTAEEHNSKSIPGSITGRRDTQSVKVPGYKDKHGIPVLYDASTQKQRKRAQPDAVSVLSHELLSPLTLIKGYSSTLLQLADVITEEQRTQYIQGIGAATNRVIQLLENLRDISRLELAVPSLIIQPTSLPDLLRKTVSEIQSQTTKHVIRLRQFGPLLMANIDRQKIEQVMTNLLVNAVKYSPQGGDIEVIVWLAHGEHELEEILGEIPPVKFPCLVVSITDSGVGIPEAELDQVFEQFYRVDNRLTRATSGAGLGLHICKIIMEAHGGHIWANSTLREGSTFSISLPVK